LVPQGDVTSLGSAIFAFLAVKAFATIEEAQKALCPPHKVFEPQQQSAAVYGRLYAMYRRLYFGFGSPGAEPVELGDVLPELRRIAAAARN
jgi:L-ribulokinase